ncbi:MAG: thiamine pyrophosphate-dependent dehydrogenase E1 component subunit alpha [Rhodospirillaceae bacterium]|nr:thiamine pyrophosphate-dependent dehydrogenase E1 component subunit alpha [Rhodospirillaceae bacterium]
MNEQASARRNAPAADRLLAQYRNMARIRAFENAAERLYNEKRIPGFVHLSTGQEAIPAGVCANLAATDQITSTHRGHGHTIAKGGDIGAMMKELFGREGGYCGGKGGSMHIADFAIGMLGANGVVTAGLPIAVGAAHAAKLLGRNTVVACFFGDGAVNRGPFLESLNWAAVFKLPVLFVCEDNRWAATTPTATMTAGPGIAARAEALGVPAFGCDGNDVVAVDDLAGELVRRVRGGGGPLLLIARSYRWSGHTSADAGAYRDAGEVTRAKADDPLQRARRQLAELGLAAEADETDKAAAAEIALAIEQAEAAPMPAPEAALADVQDVGSPAVAGFQP